MLEIRVSLIYIERKEIDELESVSVCLVWETKDIGGECESSVCSLGKEAGGLLYRK